MKLRETALDLQADWWQQDTTAFKRQLGIKEPKAEVAPAMPAVKHPRTASKPKRLEDLPKLLTIKETLVLLRISMTTLYRLFKDKEIVPISIGRKKLIPENQVIYYLWKKSNEAAQKVS